MRHRSRFMKLSPTWWISRYFEKVEYVNGVRCTEEDSCVL
jgi:hypothetical protein